MCSHQQNDNNWTHHAVQLAIDSVAKGGGPFGAIVVQDSAIIGRGYNQVTLNNDPTAHAEINAIRDACTTINNFNLDGCTLYTSCEPCPMCLSAIYWAHNSRVVYAASADEAAQAGFDDTFIAREICLPHQKKSLSITQHSCDNHTQSFINWQKKSDKTLY